MFSIHPELNQKGIKIHLFYFILEEFDNDLRAYDYLKSVIMPETEKIKKKYTIENIKDDLIVKEYRKFYWDFLKIDPTKIRPSGEALIRRILQGKELPKINYFVDGYNWASAVSRIPIAAHDLDKFQLPIELRFAKEGEKFQAIGNKEIILNGNELITVSSDGTILSQFPYRDCEKTKVTEKTRKIFVACYGVESVPKTEIKKSIDFIIEFLTKGIQNKDRTFHYSEPKYLSNFQV